MASSVRSPEDVVNIALSRVGYKGRVSSLYDGSPAGKKALDVYGQTRDATLRMRAWGFAERIVTLTPASSGAPLPWSAASVYPADCIKIRSIYTNGYGGDLNNPLPTTWTVANDGANKVIWTRFASPTAVYTAQVTDPSQWEDPDFVETLVSNLAKQLAPVLADLNAAKMADGDVKAAVQGAEEDAE